MNAKRDTQVVVPVSYAVARVLTEDEIAKVAGSGDAGTSGPTGSGGGDPGPIIIKEVDYRRDF